MAKLPAVTRILAGAVLALVLATSAPASAHSNGKVLLWLEGLALHSSGGDDWTLSVDMVDADSGTPQPGFDVAVEGSDGAGHSLAPVILADAGGGQYTTTKLTIAPGHWSLLLRADVRPGGEAAVPLRRSYPLAIQPGKDVSIGSPSPARAKPGAGPLPSLNIQIERADREGRTALWLPLRVTVTAGDASAPLNRPHVVFASARNARDDVAGPFELGNLELEGPNGVGVHEGFVIVPYGGTWTITAAVNDAQAEPGAPAALLGRASADLVVDAPVPPAGAVAAAGAAGGGPDSEPLGAFVLWAHTIVAVLWGMGVALLALLAAPAGRRLLSEQGTTWLDGRLSRIAAATWWLTGLVIGTGIYNLVKSVPYRVPLSPDQASRLFRLPYAKPYYLVLALKLLAYAVMIAASVPLIREARRRSAAAPAGAGPAVTADDEPSPWDSPGGPVAVRRPRAEVAAGPEGREGRLVKVVVTIMVAGGVIIMTAVTLLKYFHLLGEVSRLAR